MENASDVAILICSCQAYSDLWSNNYFLLNKYWPCHPKVYFVSDNVGIYDLKKVDNMFIFEGESSERILDALNKIEEEYVFIIFDDYYLTGNVDQKSLNKLLDYVISNHFDYCGFYRNRKRGSKKINGVKLAKLPLNNAYEINFFLSLWKKNSLSACLDKNENIWLAEARLTKRAKENKLNAFYSLNKNIIPFIDVVVKGKYRRKAHRYLSKNNLFISNRKRMSMKEETISNLKPLLSKAMPLFVKTILKKIYKFTGHTIYSDYSEED